MLFIGATKPLGIVPRSHDTGVRGLFWEHILVFQPVDLSSLVNPGVSWIGSNTVNGNYAETI